MFLIVFKQLFFMAAIVLCGFIFAKAFKVEEKEQKFLSKLLLYFINPCLVLNTFNIDFDPVKAKQLGFVFLLAVFIHIVMTIIAVLITSSKKKDAMDFSKINRLSIMFTNCGFVGIPLIRGVFGDEGVFFLMGYLVIFNVFVWTYGYAQLSGHVNIKKIITNPNIIAVMLGIILFLMPFTLPELIAKPLSMIGDLNSATAMILIGILFAEFKFEKKYFSNLLKVCLGRLVVVSVVVLGMVTGFYKLALVFGFASETLKLMLFVLLICSMCPCATSVPSLACIFDKDAKYASMLVCLTSLLCVLTVPTFTGLAELIFKSIS